MSCFKRLVVVLKVVERCNIDCTYCYFFHGGDTSYKLHPPYIALSTVRDIAALFEKAILDLNLEAIDISFHGGEPLMLKKSVFKEMCEIFLRTLGDKIEVNFSLQTNAMLIDEEWLTLFKMFDIGLGVSLDGPAHYNDRERIDKQGRGTYQRAVKGIRFLREHNYEQLGLLAVMNPKYPAVELYEHFVHELGIKFVDFLLPDASHDTCTESPQELREYGVYMSAIFERWLQDRDDTIHIRFIDSTLKVFFGGSTVTYGVGRDKHAKKNLPLISISSDGQLFPVDELRTLGHDALFKAGYRANNTSLKDFFAAPRFALLAETLDRVSDVCQTCCWLNVCGGGSLVSRFSLEKNFNNRSIFCEGLQYFYQNVATHLVNSGEAIDELGRNIGLLSGKSPQTV